MPKINKILEVHLSLDGSLVSGDKLSGPRAFRRVVMTVVAVVVAPFFAEIIIATGGQSK